MRLDHLLSKEERSSSFEYCSILKVCEDRLSGKRNLVEDGGVAQLGEHLPCTQGVRSSSLLISTTGGRESREAIVGGTRSTDF